VKMGVNGKKAAPKTTLVRDGRRLGREGTGEQFGWRRGGRHDLRYTTIKIAKDLIKWGGGGTGCGGSFSTGGGNKRGGGGRSRGSKTVDIKKRERQS